MFDQLIYGRDTHFALAADTNEDISQPPVMPHYSALAIMRDQIDEVRSFTHPYLASAGGLASHQRGGRRYVSGQMDMLGAADPAMRLMLSNICSANVERGWPTLSHTIDETIIPLNERAGVVTVRPSDVPHPMVIRKHIGHWDNDQLFRKLTFRSFSISLSEQGQLICQTDLLGRARQKQISVPALALPARFVLDPECARHILKITDTSAQTLIHYPLSVSLSLRRQSLAPVFRLAEDSPEGFRYGPSRVTLNVEFLVHERDLTDWLVSSERVSVQLILKSDNSHFILFDSPQMQVIASTKQLSAQDQMFRAAISLEPIIQPLPSDSFVFVLSASAS